MSYPSSVSETGNDQHSCSPSPFTLVLKTWPVIAAATIGLCFLTQAVAKLFGVDLPDQANIAIVKRCFEQAFSSARAFGIAAFLAAQVLVIMPVLEEIYFRHFLYWRNLLKIERKSLLFALIPTGTILLTGVLALAMQTVRIQIFSEFPLHPLVCYVTALICIAVAEFAIRFLLGRLIAKVSRLAIMIFSAIIFSAAHYISQPWPDAAFVALFFFGCAQCWLYRKTDRLWCAMLNHMLFNLTNLILLFLV